MLVLGNDPCHRNYAVASQAAKQILVPSEKLRAEA